MDPQSQTTNGPPTSSSRPRVVIIGAGFAGIEAAQCLKGAPVDVMLVDRNNYHKFQPLLYQIATAGLTSGNVTMPVRDLLRGQDNARFRRANVVDVDPNEQRIYAEGGASMTYDDLILAVGAVTNYVDIKGVREYAFPLKDIPDALNLRNHVLERFEEADCNVALRDSCALDAVIVGGGPTGVETAAMLAELFRETMCRDFDWVDPGTGPGAPARSGLGPDDRLLPVAPRLHQAIAGSAGRERRAGNLRDGGH